MLECIIVLGIIFITALYVVINYIQLRKLSLAGGIKNVVDMAKIIRDGAKTFLKKEFKVIAITVAAFAVFFTLVINVVSGITFIAGALMSSIACIVGMLSATYANSYTVHQAVEAEASNKVGKAVKAALKGGSICGLIVQLLGLFGIVAIFMIGGGVKPNDTGHGLLSNLVCNPSLIRISTYSLGCSIVAMFNRVAGGNFTKAADIGADLTGKHQEGLEEDDPRNAAVVADCVGDMLNDTAGNCSDLLESFVATISAALAIAAILYSGNPLLVEWLNAACLFPIVLAGGGLLSCLIGAFIISKRKMGSDPSKELNLMTYISSGLTIILGFFLSMALFKDIELCDSFKIGWLSPFLSAVLGIVVGVAIGMITEYYTSAKYKPTKGVAEIAKEGASFAVSKGNALGSRSVFLPILIIAVATIISYVICGIYGIAISAVGMLSFLGTTVSIDAFGPISDNAGGLATLCKLNEDIRKVTDKLDSAGNTTAAIGKGFAIGSAAFATVALIISFISSYSSGGDFVLNIADPFTIAGALIGAALIEYFIAILTNNTLDSAKALAEICKKQFQNPEVKSGKKYPDYNLCIKEATDRSLKKMLMPSIISLIVPVVVGLLFGVKSVGGLLIGATIIAIPSALRTSNSGGAFDNAKKYIEDAKFKCREESSQTLKILIICDTIGDILKDVVAPALDIFIKSMATEAIILAPIFVSYCLLG